QRALSLGAAPTMDELTRAWLAVGIAELRHVDARRRAKGRALVAALEPGARAAASPVERGAFGVWLWERGARREAYEQLAAWHAATKPPRDEALQAAYLRALAWWSPVWLGEVPPPPSEDLVGPERCWFPGTDCAPPAVVESPRPPAPALDANPRA